MKCKKIKENGIRLIGILLATLMLIFSFAYLSMMSEGAVDGEVVKIEAASAEGNGFIDFTDVLGESQE